MKDCTQEYTPMLEAFECDFVLARDGDQRLDYLSEKIRNKDKQLLHDIELLEKLSFGVRYGRIKIMEEERSAS